MIRVLRLSVAPFLLLITPFVGFVHYQGHGLANPEVMLVILPFAAVALVVGAASAFSPAVGIVALAALVAFFADVQAGEPGLRRLGLVFLASCLVFWILRRHAHRIVSVVMATLLALTFLSPRSEAVGVENAPHASLSGGHADRPLILHLLLDEYIGLEGLPPDLTPAGFKDDRQAFFVERGFRVFGKAYSEYSMTVWSVPHLLNLSPGRYVSDLTVPGPAPRTYRLTRNAYFDRLARLGYAIRVHEPDYLYLCADSRSASCRTYGRSLSVLDRLDVPLDVKVSVVGGTYLALSEAYGRMRDHYRIARLTSARNLALPAWNWEQTVPAPARTMPMFDAVAADLSNAQRGTLVFAHILMPHYPYVYDANCAQRPANEWLLRSDNDRVNVLAGIINVPEGRAARYASYFQQVACTERKIARLLEAIPHALRDDAIIIVQGDHGSRITLVDPTEVATATQAVSDYADAFSTMFAVRSAAIEPGYDLRMTPITCLLRTLVDSNFASTSGIDACSSPPTVFFATGGKTPSPRPLLDFAPAKAMTAVAGYDK
jgi:hypothetical protein